MIKRYKHKRVLLVVLPLLLMIASCSKDKTTTPVKTTPTPVTATPVSLGLYEESDVTDSVIYRLIFMIVAKVGTVTLNSNYNGMIFDTGSGGLVLDAHDIIADGMITTSGFNFTGDSTVVDGITITNKTSTIVYGDDANTDATVYGNLAYANVEIGEPSDKTITVKRLPFFLYYKSVQNGKPLPNHEFDVLGVNSEFDKQFSNGVTIGSPFQAYDPGTGLTKGFKMAALGASNFATTEQIPLTPNVVTVGLTASDIGSSSPYQFTTLEYNSSEGAPPILAANIAYGGTSASGYVVYDTGTAPYNYLEDSNAGKTTTMIPAGTAVSITTTSPTFNYPFTVTATDNESYVENPKQSGTNVSVLSLNFFLNNSYLMDFPDHKLGVKND